MIVLLYLALFLAISAALTWRRVAHFRRLSPLPEQRAIDRVGQAERNL
jgi:hypothetical protein